MTREDEIAFCREQLDHARKGLALLESGVRVRRGVPGTGTTDVTDKHIEHLRGSVAYWRARLRILGVADA